MDLCFVYNINVSEYRRGNQNRQYRETVNIGLTRHKTKTNKTKTQRNICWTPVCTNTNTNNVNKPWALLQTTGDRDEPNIVFVY